MIDNLLLRLRRTLHIDPYGNLLKDRTGSRLRKALSPRYVFSKVRATVYELRHPNHPWITKDAIDWLTRNLRKEHRGFEWGSGNGTRWFAHQTASIVSVEHHAEWAERVKEQLAKERLTNVDYRVVTEDRYLDIIGEFPDGTFDYVVVDGLFRDEALARSIPKVRAGGFIIFDNVNWYLPSKSTTPHSRSFADGASSPLFAESYEKLKSWRVEWTANGINDTAIFIKP
jgi:predicted O-methyltransferase YrrM